jgi:ankyrin repeat protein
MPPEFQRIVNHHWELTEAGRRGELGRLRSLLAAGADANARDQYGSTPLHSAVSWGDREIASLLLDHGADVHARGWEGWTPMHTAAGMGNPGVIGLLLDRGAEIDARDNAGWTPLHLAARLGRAEVASYLLDHGADPHARNADGQTPLEVALGNERLWDRQGELWRVLGKATSRDNGQNPGSDYARTLDATASRAQQRDPDRGIDR